MLHAPCHATHAMHAVLRAGVALGPLGGRAVVRLLVRQVLLRDGRHQRVACEGGSEGVGDAVRWRSAGARRARQALLRDRQRASPACSPRLPSALTGVWVCEQRADGQQHLRTAGRQAGGCSHQAPPTGCSRPACCLLLPLLQADQTAAQEQSHTQVAGLHCFQAHRRQRLRITRLGDGERGGLPLPQGPRTLPAPSAAATGVHGGGGVVNTPWRWSARGSTGPSGCPGRSGRWS